MEEVFQKIKQIHKEVKEINGGLKKWTNDSRGSTGDSTRWARDSTGSTGVLMT